MNRNDGLNQSIHDVSRGGGNNSGCKYKYKLRLY